MAFGQNAKKQKAELKKQNKAATTHVFGHGRHSRTSRKHTKITKVKTKVKKKKTKDRMVALGTPYSLTQVPLTRNPAPVKRQSARKGESARGGKFPAGGFHPALPTSCRRARRWTRAGPKVPRGATAQLTQSVQTRMRVERRRGTSARGWRSRYTVPNQK